MDRPVLCGGSTSPGLLFAGGRGAPGAPGSRATKKVPGSLRAVSTEKNTLPRCWGSFVTAAQPTLPGTVSGDVPPRPLPAVRGGPVQGRAVPGCSGWLSALQPSRFLLRTVVGTLGLQAKKNTPLPATQVTKGDKGGGGGLPQVAEPGASTALWTLWRCQGPRHRTTEARLPALRPAKTQAHALESVFAAVQSAPGCRLGLSRPFRGVKRLKKLPQRVGEGQEVVLVTAAPSLRAPDQRRRPRGSGAQAEGDGFTTWHTRPAWLRPGQRASRGAAALSGWLLGTDTESR